jgi:2-dehydropantoate 2-reductase
MTIGILGIGAVGGFFGGRLASFYHHSDGVKTVFIPGPSSLAQLQEHGLKLITPNGEQIIYPQLVSRNAEAIGALDVLIVTTKSYSLEEAITPFLSTVTGNTLVLPLLNGVSAAGTLKKLLPQATVLEGCVYVNAERTSPGIVEKTGTLEKLFFGKADGNDSDKRLAELQEVFKAAGLDSYLSDSIERDIWEKYLFNAAVATATSYHDKMIGQLLESPECRDTLEKLLDEAYAVSVAKGIPLPADIVVQTVRKIEAQPYNGTSSMHRDFRKGGKTEYHSLSGYMIRLGKNLGVATPTFDMIVASFEKREEQQHGNGL